ncbi:MAG: methionyl-tRNA formyltransferase [Candidatus Margulisbacteria bacterium]|nr:methionyl-tRNA formyltransferase [Candidatus Margulisiibacteriota bacterium]
MKFNRVLFMGSPEYAVPTLKSLVDFFGIRKILGVVSQPVRARGRGREVSPTPVHQFAHSLGLMVFTPESKEEVASVVETLQPDLVVVIAYGKILPKSVTDHYFCVNLHGSLLPKYRGASPMQATILAGDTESGVTLICMNERMDAGEILGLTRVSLADETLGQLHDRLSLLSAEVMINYLKGNCPAPIIQDEKLATYCTKIQKEDLLLDLSLDASLLVRKVKAFSPFPGAYVVTASGLRVKILDAQVENGKFVPVLVKPEGKGEMSYGDYVRGYGAVC